MSTHVQIEFLQDFGDLPLLVADGSALTYFGIQNPPTITVTTIRKGTKGMSPHARHHVTSDPQQHA